MPAFDGKWQWVDSSGQPQPRVSLFWNKYSADNPYVEVPDRTYRDLAVELRDGTCLECHSPNNKQGMGKLVIFQTPSMPPLRLATFSSRYETVTCLRTSGVNSGRSAQKFVTRSYRMGKHFVSPDGGRRMGRTSSPQVTSQSADLAPSYCRALALKHSIAPVFVPPAGEFREI
jgi:hypothetical protein